MCCTTVECAPPLEDDKEAGWLCRKVNAKFKTQQRPQAGLRIGSLFWPAAVVTTSPVTNPAMLLPSCQSFACSPPCASLVFATWPDPVSSWYLSLVFLDKTQSRFVSSSFCIISIIMTSQPAQRKRQAAQTRQHMTRQQTNSQFAQVAWQQIWGFGCSHLWGNLGSCPSWKVQRRIQMWWKRFGKNELWRW